VDFTVPYMYYTEEMLLRKTPKGTINLLQFLNPFHSEVWYATLISLVVISVAVVVVNYFSPYGNKDENGRGSSEEFSFFNSVWFTFACILQQGAENQPRSLSGRNRALCFKPFHSRVPKIQDKFQIPNIKVYIVPCESTTGEVSFEW